MPLRRPSRRHRWPLNRCRSTEAARLLGIPTRDLLRLIYEQRIRYVIVDGIAHVPVDAIDEYRAKAS